MKNKLCVICFMCFALILSACSSGGSSGGSSAKSSSEGSVEGALPNGSEVFISNSDFVLDARESTALGELKISGGSPNSSYTFVLDSSVISVTTTPDPCTLGTEGTGLPTSCGFSLSTSPNTPAGKYTIALSAYGSDGSVSSLTPITVIVNGSTLADAKAITAFSINNVNATISGQNIGLTLPYGTNPTALVATFVTTGVSVTVNGVVQNTGVTPNNFTSPVVYTVTAADGSTQNYTVTVTIIPGAIAITTPGFSVGGSIIQGGAFKVVATLTGNNVANQTITVSDLSSYGISVTSNPSTCTLSTTSNPSCTFTVSASWNLAATGNYILQLNNTGSLTPDQTSIAFSVYSPAVYLPKTGQSATFGWPLLTVPNGADGNPAIGLNWPSTRFVTGSGAEAECITDTLTGLTWAKNAGLKSSTWVDALTYTAGLTLCGHSDWRLPNINELQSLVNDGYTGIDQASTTQVNWLQSQGFTNVQKIRYYSSTTNAKNTNDAWVISMENGQVEKFAKHKSYVVWAVRGGQANLAQANSTTVAVAQVPQTGVSKTMGIPSLIVPAGADGNPAIGKAWPNPRFESYPLSSSESACITDKLTGLMWAKNANLKSSNWYDALTYTAGLTLCGHSDWRLPNKRELMSLVNYGYTGIDEPSTTQINWLQSQGFTNLQVYYWSSSTYVSDTNLGLIIGMNSGTAILGGKGFTNAVWPVRGGK